MRRDKVKLCLIIGFGVVCILFGVYLIIKSFIIGDYSATEIVSGKFRYISRNGNWVYSILGAASMLVGYFLIRYEL